MISAYHFYPCIVFNAQTEMIGSPENPVLGQNYEIRCRITTDELLRANGTLEFTLPNGTVFERRQISSPETSIVLQLNPLRQEDTVGGYTCTANGLQSPEFPGFTLQQFAFLNFGMCKSMLNHLICGILYWYSGASDKTTL